MEFGGFQKTILIIALIILSIVLLFVGAVISKRVNDMPWPPSINPCPDYWKSDASGNCTNFHNLGVCKNNVMNFAKNPTFSGASAMCNKYNWANNCKITWDGITYGVPNPCTAVTTS